MWFIGDHLIRTAYPYLQQIQRDHDGGRLNYLHTTYDTYVYYPVFTEINVLTMIRSCLVEGLNKRNKLPNAIIILLSDQLIMEDPLYLPSEIDRKLKWIIREVTSLIKMRKSLLPTKAYIFGEPRIMFVRCFQNTRANYIPSEVLMKYNNMLRKVCISKAIYTIPVDSYNDASLRCFDYDGKTQMNGGFELLWHDIIQGLKKHDKSDEYAEIARIIKENTKQDKRYDTQRAESRRLDHGVSPNHTSDNRETETRRCPSDRPRRYAKERDHTSHRSTARSLSGHRSRDSPHRGTSERWKSPSYYRR